MFLSALVEYQIFLKSPTTDLSLEFVRFQKIDYVEIVARLEAQFPHAFEKEATNSDFKKIEEFKVFLQSINGNFKKYKKVLKSVVKARHDYFAKFGKELVIFQFYKLFSFVTRNNVCRF